MNSTYNFPDELIEPFQKISIMERTKENDPKRHNSSKTVSKTVLFLERNLENMKTLDKTVKIINMIGIRRMAPVEDLRSEHANAVDGHKSDNVIVMVTGGTLGGHVDMFVMLLSLEMTDAFGNRTSTNIRFLREETSSEMFVAEELSVGKLSSKYWIDWSNEDQVQCTWFETGNF
jgi:hypothetical protein